MAPIQLFANDTAGFIDALGIQKPLNSDEDDEVDINDDDNNESCAK